MNQTTDTVLSPRLRQDLIQRLATKRKPLLWTGIVLAVIGLCAMLSPVVSTLVTLRVMGWLFLIAGIAGVLKRLLDPGSRFVFRCVAVQPAVGRNRRLHDRESRRGNGVRDHHDRRDLRHRRRLPGGRRVRTEAGPWLGLDADVSTICYRRWHTYYKRYAGHVL